MGKKLEMRVGRGVAEWEKKYREGRDIKRGRDRAGDKREGSGREWQIKDREGNRYRE